MAINWATIQNWMFLLSPRKIRYLRSGRNLNDTKSSRNMMYVVHEVTLSYRWRADTRPQPSWSWMRSCYSNVTSFPITADKSNYVLWRSQTSRRTTCHTCFYVHRSHPDSSSRIATLLGALIRGVSSLWWWGHDENVFRPLPLTECCLQARDWTFWDIICTFDPSHLQLIHITWTNRPSWGSGHKISDCFFDCRPSGPC